MLLELQCFAFCGRKRGSNILSVFVCELADEFARTLLMYRVGPPLWSAFFEEAFVFTCWCAHVQEQPLTNKMFSKQFLLGQCC